MAALLLLLSLALQSLPARLQSWFMYERGALQSGEWWRVFTTHLIHLDWTHFSMNMLGLGLIVTLFFRELRGKMLLMALPCSAIAVSLGLFLFNTEVEWYIGMSGALHGLLAACLLRSLLHAPRLGLALLMLLIGKLLLEHSAGAPAEAIFGDSVQVIGAAHLYGALAGTMIGAAFLLGDLSGKRAD